MKAALTRYRVAAYLTGVMLLLLTAHIIVQVIQVEQDHVAWDEATGLGEWIPGASRGIPTIHGYIYLAYVILAVDLWFRFKTRLPVWQTVLVVLAGVIPGMTFVAERWVTRRVTAMIADEAASAAGAAGGMPPGTASGPAEKVPSGQ